MANSTSKPLQIVPRDGWVPNCKYGLQRADSTDAGRLVRLEDVAIWLAETLPRDRVVQELFGRLIFEGETDCLYVLSAHSFAMPLTFDGRASRAAAGFWQYVDFVDHDTLSEFVVREVGNAWNDCWPGLADPATDDDWYIQRVIAANRERNKLAKLRLSDQAPQPKFASFDTDERRTQLNRLRRLAIPFVNAYAVWGWGTVATEEAANAAGVAVALSAGDVTDIESLRCYRLQFTGKPPQQQPVWPVAHVDILRAAVLKHGRGGQSYYAALLGYTPQRIGQLIRPKKAPETDPEARPHATYVSGLGRRQG